MTPDALIAQLEPVVMEAYAALEEGKPPLTNPIKRALVKAKATSGVTFGAREKEFALMKLEECEMHAQVESFDIAKRRLMEALMWAKRGIGGTRKQAA